MSLLERKEMTSCYLGYKDGSPEHVRLEFAIKGTMTILFFLVESVRLLLDLLLCPAKLLTPSPLLLLHLHLLLDPAFVVLTQSVLLPVQTKVEDGGANESDDDTDPDMVTLINLVADAKSLLLHLVAS